MTYGGDGRRGEGCQRRKQQRPEGNRGIFRETRQLSDPHSSRPRCQADSGRPGASLRVSI